MGGSLMRRQLTRLFPFFFFFLCFFSLFSSFFLFFHIFPLFCSVFPHFFVPPFFFFFSRFFFLPFFFFRLLFFSFFHLFFPLFSSLFLPFLWRYTHIHTPLDDSTRPLDNSTNSTLHNPERAGALVTSIIVDGGPHGWVPVNTHSTPVLPMWEEAVGSSQTLHLHEANHEGNGRSIHNMEPDTFHSQEPAQVSTV